MGNRIFEFRKLLKQYKIDSFLVSSAINISYLTGFLNFSKDEREAYLLITESSAILFTDNRYIEAVEKIIPKSIKVLHINTLFKQISVKGGKKVGVEDNFTIAELKRFKRESGSNFVLSKTLIEDLRTTKDAEEIKNIKLACQLTDKTYSHILKNIRIDITEKEVAWEIEKYIKENGGTLAFDSIVAFGPNSSIPHHATSNKKLSDKDEFVLLDFGAKVNGYCSDMTRTILTKNSSTRAKKMYQAVLAAQKSAVNYVIDNISNNKCSNIASVANKVMKERGFEQIPHGLGHGIGLEVHEKPHLSPKSADVLNKGMTFTIEPGIYIPGFGGVRIEDDYLMNEKGIAPLTNSPK